MKRSTISRGIYRDASGYCVRWRDHGIIREQRFPADTPPDVLERFRLRQLSQAQPATGERLTSFARDVARFLRPRRAKACYKSDRSHLKPWIKLFGRRSRWAIKGDDIQRAIGDWEDDQKSAKEIRHRVKLLQQLYRTLAPESPTPCDRVTLPTVPDPRPVYVALSLIDTVAERLRLQELAGRLRDAKTRARFVVLATTGQRPAQLVRAQPFDVDLVARRWVVRPAKGDRGTVLYLNDDMLAAWQLFVAADAFGDYDQRSFVKTLQRNGWPKGVRPYNLRHRVGQALNAAGVDLGDIQTHMGHKSPTTTRKFYVSPVPARLQAASAAIDRQVDPAAFAAYVPRPVKRRKAATA